MEIPRCTITCIVPYTFVYRFLGKNLSYCVPRRGIGKLQGRLVFIFTMNFQLFKVVVTIGIPTGNVGKLVLCLASLDIPRLLLFVCQSYECKMVCFNLYCAQTLLFGTHVTFLMHHCHGFVFNLTHLLSTENCEVSQRWR